MAQLRRSTRVKAEPKYNEEESDDDFEAVVKDEPEPPKKKPKVEQDDEIEPEKQLEVGDEIPDLTLLDEDENPISLKDAAKVSKYLVIFAYPKASTPGCTRQVCGFQQNFESLKGLDATVFGLSADAPKAQKNFVTKQGLEYHLLSDPKKELIGPLGAKKSPSGIKRSHWIFVDGVLTIKKIQISPEDSFQGAKTDIEELIEKSK